MIYVEIDVAKNKHDCFITNSDGEILFKASTIQNSQESFNELYPKIRSVKVDMSKIKVVLEATGHHPQLTNLDRWNPLILTWRNVVPDIFVLP